MNALLCFRGTRGSGAVCAPAGLTPALALLLPCLLGALLACAYEGEDPRSDGGFTVRDSMGLVIAESRQAGWRTSPELQWSIDTVPLLQVGSVEDSIFARVYPVEGAIRLDDGRIVVAGRRHTIVWFSDRGEYLFERGREGDGPGEFRSISRMIFLEPDSVAAYSGSNRSWTVFDGEGRGNTIRLSALNRSTLRPSRSPDGRWLGWLARTLPAEEAIPIRSTDPRNGLPVLPARELDPEGDKLFSWLVGVSSDGMRVDTLAEVVGPTGFALMGMPAVTGTARHIVLGEAQEHALLLLTPEGTPVRSIRWAGEDLTISPADDAAWRVSLMADRNIRKSMQLAENPAAVQQAARDGIAGARLGARKGAYLALFADPEEAVWVLLNTFRNEPELYSVIDPEGRYLGEVRMPPDFVLTQVGRDFVLGLWRDKETDLEFVRLYRIRKPGARNGLGEPRSTVGSQPLTALDPLPELRLVPELRIDGHAEDLVPIVGRGLAVAEDGTIAVGQHMDHQVRLYSVAGRILAKLGRDGEGPGEFRGVAAVGWLGDTLWVHDQFLNRLTLLGADGSLVGTTRLAVRGRESGGLEDVGELSPLTLRADGTLVGKVTLHPEDNGRFVRATTQGEIFEVLAEDWDRSGSRVRVVRTGGGGSMIGLPFSAPRISRASPDGSRLVFVSAEVEGEEVGTFRVQVLAARGDTLVDRRYPCEAVPIPRRVGDSVIEARTRELRNRRGGAESAEAFARRARVPEVYPPLWDLEVGRDGTLWIRLPRTGEGDPYVVLDPDGLPVGRVVLPLNATLGVAERGWVWTIETDSLGVPSVLRHRVEG